MFPKDLYIIKELFGFTFINLSTQRNILCMELTGFALYALDKKLSSQISQVLEIIIPALYTRSYHTPNTQPYFFQK